MDIQRAAHIYFDLDGTLVDPREGIAGSMRRPA
jgi:phosphoglycolate phosphatase-like HAD superfamily hydrolase